MDILFIGHSLIEFFNWQRKFPAHNVSNLGVAGETVEGLLSRLERIIGEYPSADLIFLMTGLNNLAMGDSNFLDPYRKILIRLSSAYPSARVYINSLLPTLLEFIPDEAIRDANNSLKALAEKTGTW